MRLKEFKCGCCGKIFEEFVKDGQTVFCPQCKEKAEVNMCGKIYTSTGSSSGGCSGDCSTCKGCGK